MSEVKSKPYPWMDSLKLGTPIEEMSKFEPTAKPLAPASSENVAKQIIRITTLVEREPNIRALAFEYTSTNLDAFYNILHVAEVLLRISRRKPQIRGEVYI